MRQATQPIPLTGILGIANLSLDKIWRYSQSQFLEILFNTNGL
jgi:hypothetical protein